LEEFAAAGISTTIIPRRWAIDPLADWQLVRHVRRLRPDVVHTWDTVPGMFGAVAMGLPLVAGRYRIDRWKPAWEWEIERRFMRHAARIVTNSESVRAWCAFCGLPADTIVVVPSGVEPARMSNLSREALLRELKLPGDARLIGVVARLVPEKRVKDLIWAADLLRVLHDNLRLLVIGDGPLRQQLEEYARLASDLEHIRFLGTGNDVWRITPHLNVLWDASESAGQSAAILEAMAAGVPVIASDTRTNRELVVEDATGYLIRLGTRAGRAARARLTDRIFNDQVVSARLNEGAQKRAFEIFNAERMVLQYLEVYDQGLIK
jgi:glycosyltransferase involved in cell wall biosynthesis